MPLRLMLSTFSSVSERLFTKTASSGFQAERRIRLAWVLFGTVRSSGHTIPLFKVKLPSRSTP